MHVFKFNLMRIPGNRTLKIRVCTVSWKNRASQVALVIKNLPANVRDLRDMGSIPGLGRSPGEGNGHTLQYSCLKNCTKEPGGLESVGSQRVKHD